MPTYQYRCPEGHEFERVQKMAGKPRTRCPRCGRAATRLISGGAGLIFKGSGFYITDYGKDGKGRRQEKETEKAPEVAPAVGDQSAPKPGKAESEKPEKPSRKKGSP
jgi:putative FmdB family regulatory protein